MDMSLDDAAAKARPNRGGHGHGHGHGRGSRSFKSYGGDNKDYVHPLARGDDDNQSSRSSRSSFGRRNNRPQPYQRPSRRNADEDTWQRDLYSGARSRPASSVTSARKASVEVSNLSDTLDSQDFSEIFEEFSNSIKSVKMGKTRDGDADGTAVIVFKTRAIAQQCVREYDRAKVDGKPMLLRLMDPEDDESDGHRFKVEKSRSATRSTGGGGGGRPSGFYQPPRGGSRGESKASMFGSALDELDSPSGGNNRKGRGRGRGRGRARGRGGSRGAPRVEKSLTDLDAEMEAYQQSRNKDVTAEAE